jgi:hypothetical protein
MLSLTKKSETQPAAAQLWHTNFRNFERLPDTKVVRTNFFIITVAVGITLGLLLWLGYREYHIFSLGEQIAEGQKVIDSNAKQNNEALRLSRIFADEQRKLNEAQAFRSTPITPFEYIILLGKTLPKEISIESLDARMSVPGGPTFVLKGLMAGTPDQASGLASSYVDMLLHDPNWNTIFDQITLTNLTRDSRSGFLAFEINFKVRARK